MPINTYTYVNGVNSATGKKIAIFSFGDFMLRFIHKAEKQTFLVYLHRKIKTSNSELEVDYQAVKEFEAYWKGFKCIIIDEEIDED